MRNDPADATLDFVRTFLDYDQDGGRFTWKATRGKARAGRIAGTVGRQGYRKIGINGKERPVARLVWLVEHHQWPAHELIHINGDRLDDRICNLRERTHSRTWAPLTQDRIMSLFTYDEATGVFTPMARRKGSRPSSVPAGWINGAGYVLITVDGSVYRAHRLAWLYSHGRWPEHHIDHINGNPSDNRLCNLREATHAQNMANSKRPKTNTSGLKGVQWHKGARKWMARIRDNGRDIYLGLFDTAEEAHGAYCDAAFARKGRYARTS